MRGTVETGFATANTTRRTLQESQTAAAGTPGRVGPPPQCALSETGAKRYGGGDTGEVRDEIHHELEAMAGSVISDTDHSAANEYGTARMAAHPFMRPAFEQYAPAFLAEVQAIFG